MRRLFGSLLFLATLHVCAASANATVVPANWWSDRTSSSGVVDPPGPNGPERLRFTQGSLVGFAEGTVYLPSNQNWRINTIVTTDSQYNIPSEYVDVFINSVFQQRFFNTPLGTVYPFQRTISGSQFNYRFEFSSPSTNFGSHLVVGRGTVSSVPEPSVLFMASVGVLLILRRGVRADD
jgi:hypothetical protein